MSNDLDFMTEFDPEQAVKDSGGGSYDPIPPGWYYGRVTQSEVQNTKAGTGKMVFVRLDIEGPQHAGRVLFDRMVVAHPNPDAAAIGRARFGSLCLACGFAKKPNDTKELLGKVCGFKVKTEKSKEFGDKSVPIDFKPHGISGASGSTGAAGVAAPDDDDIPF
jgi:hypothetical protein